MTDKDKMRANVAMRVLKIIMWIVGVINLVLGAISLYMFGFGKGLSIDGQDSKLIIYLLLYWIFVLPPSSGFGFGFSVFFIYDGRKIGPVKKEDVALAVIFGLSLLPGLMILGSLIYSMFTM